MVWATTKGRGVLVNCRNEEPSGLVASTSSPAISGAAALDFHTACPCRTVHPGWLMSSAGSGPMVRQPVTATATSARIKE